MSKQTDKSLFMVSSLPGLYQALLRGIESSKDLGNRLIREIKAAHAFRHTDRVSELSKILINVPVKEYQLIAEYYLVWCECRERNYQSAELERIIQQTQTYKAQALLTRGTFDLYQSKPEPALYFYREALKSSRNVPEFISVSLAIAQLKGIEGFNESALKDMESLIPLLKHADARLYYGFLNSYAVELADAGRKYEARNISNIVLASSFAHAYPEWQETAQELKKPNRSFISIPGSLQQIEHKHVEIETKPTPKSKKYSKPADVLPFKQLKEVPEPDKPERVSNIDLDDMTDTQKLDFIMTALRTGAVRPSYYNDIIYQAGMLKTGPASKVVDLEDETVMTDKLIEWAHLIDPEDLAGVISALRDCDDKLRRVNLMDAMIRKLFEYSAACGVSEEAWRKKVERRLPKQGL